MKVIVIQLERAVVWLESAFGAPVRPRAGGSSDSSASDGGPLTTGLRRSFPAKAPPSRTALGFHLIGVLGPALHVVAIFPINLVTSSKFQLTQRTGRPPDNGSEILIL